MGELIQAFGGNGPAWTLIAVIIGGLGWMGRYILVNLFGREINPKNDKPYGLLIPVAEAHVNTMNSLREMAQSVQENNILQAKTLEELRDMMESSNREVSEKFQQFTAILNAVDKRLVEMASHDHGAEKRDAIVEDMRQAMTAMCIQWGVKLSPSSKLNYPNSPPGT